MNRGRYPWCSRGRSTRVLPCGALSSSVVISSRPRRARPYRLHLLKKISLAFLGAQRSRFYGLAIDRSRQTAMHIQRPLWYYAVYYHEAQGRILFCRQKQKAILAVCPNLRATDPARIGQNWFPAAATCKENRTLFRGVHVLPGASAWLFRRGTVQQKHTYFEPREWEEQAPLNENAYYEALRSTLAHSLPPFFNGKQPIGIALTGGLDTRVLMAWRNAPPQTMPCYTWGGTYRDSQDVIVARKVADICKQRHQVVTVGSDFLSQFGRYAERSLYLTDVSVDVSRSPDLFVSERARQIAPVGIVVTYGSEVLPSCPGCLNPHGSDSPGVF